MISKKKIKLLDKIVALISKNVASSIAIVVLSISSEIPIKELTFTNFMSASQLNQENHRYSGPAHVTIEQSSVNLCKYTLTPLCQYCRISGNRFLSDRMFCPSDLSHWFVQNSIEVILSLNRSCNFKYHRRVVKNCLQIFIFIYASGVDLGKKKAGFN